ncbi:MAG: hypothetical protein K2M06_02655 [Muribaculaceae bacterium]|nr:hypothetical protein [Muribaculaceae bacterium]
MGKIHEHVAGLLVNPPMFGCGLSAAGNIPNQQKYDATIGAFEPDYTLTPLTLQVDVAAIDSDKPLSNVNARTLLTNIHWYELADDGTRTEIVFNGGVSTPAGYASLINTEGHPDAGQLQVARNAAPGKPLMLQFEADLFTGADTFHICENINIQCRDVTPSVRCKFDMPDIVPYNPIHDPSTLPVALSVWENGVTADSSHYIPVWEVRRPDGSWSEYGSEHTDYWLDIAADKHSAVLDLELMGDGIALRVRLRYDPNGNPAAVSLPAADSNVPTCRLESSRSFGRYDHQLINVTNMISAWCTVVRPTVIFKDSLGNIADPDKFFIVTFYAGEPGKALTDADIVGTGCTLDLPASKGNGEGMKIGYAVDEIGPLKAWTDADGSILTDADGKILLIR